MGRGWEGLVVQNKESKAEEVKLNIVIEEGYGAFVHLKGNWKGKIKPVQRGIVHFFSEVSVG